MKPTRLFMVTLLALLGTSMHCVHAKTYQQGTSATAAEPKLKSERDSLAYCMGIDIGRHMKELDSMLDVNILAQGIGDRVAGQTQITEEEAQAFLQEYFTVRIPARARERSEEFLSNVQKQNPNVKKTPSGLLYEVIVEGGVKARFDTDTVMVHYRGMFPEGAVFDSSYERGEPSTFPLNTVVAGWTEGMKLVGKGGKIKLWIHPDLAYGESGLGRSIPPNQVLVFEVELLDVRPFGDGQNPHKRFRQVR